MVRLGMTRTARTALTALVVALALSVTGCSVVGPGEITGGQGGNEPGWNEPDATPGDDDGTGGEDHDGEDGRPNGGGIVPNPIGSIEVKIEVGATSPPRLFQLEASACTVSPERIQVIGAGSESGTGATAFITVDTTMRELLHAPTGTYSASGAIVITLGGEQWTSDARLITIQGATLPSMFEYRVSDARAEFRTAWFSDAGADAAGYVHIDCTRG